MTNGMNGCACNNSRMRAFMCPNLAQIHKPVETPLGHDLSPNDSAQARRGKSALHGTLCSQAAPERWFLCPAAISSATGWRSTVRAFWRTPAARARCSGGTGGFQLSLGGFGVVGLGGFEMIVVSPCHPAVPASLDKGSQGLTPFQARATPSSTISYSVLPVTPTASAATAWPA